MVASVTLPVRVDTYKRNGHERVVDRHNAVVCEMSGGLPAAPLVHLLNRTGKLQLPDVTLVMIETQEHELARMAIDDCLRQADFNHVLVFTDKPEFFDGLPADTTILPVPNWTSKLGWSRFNWHGVGEHLCTSHALMIQWDSWIIDPRMWRQAYLDYDYVGAPWWYEDQYNVGNGGFSLRSRRLFDVLTENQGQFPIVTDLDDDLVCRSYRPLLERQFGLKWAPADLAMDFAFECMRPFLIGRSHFGFHAINNWPAVLPFDRLKERLEVAVKSTYLKAHHLGSLVDTLTKSAEHERERIKVLHETVGDAKYFSIVTRMRNGDYEGAWLQYECRWDTKWFAEMRNLLDVFQADGIPQWRGEPLAGKTIMIWHEQGYGDTILMQRYIPLIEAMGAEVHVGVPDALVPLFRANHKNVHAMVPKELMIDFHCPMFSLPGPFGTMADTVPPPCLRPPVAKHIDVKLATGVPNIGITWEASAKFPHNEFRTMEFEQFKEFLVPGAHYVALQYGLNGGQIRDIRDAGVEYAVYNDFGELASIMMQLDLVITVCTATANLAASLGKPVWVLLCDLPDMRWGKSDVSPWYPHARMFRQSYLGEWEPVVQAVKTELPWFIEGPK